MDYTDLREEYPEVISADQLYRICHISKRKTLWLLENGVIPCKDSGKLTRRFQIRLDDVIEFLQNRDAGALEDIIPRGIFSSAGYPETVQPLDAALLAELFLDAWQDAPDMLTATQAAELTGYGTTSINQWLQNGKVQAIHYYGKNLFSKESLAAWLASPAGQGIHAKSEVHRRAMEEVSEMQNSAMEFGSMTL